MFFKSYQMWQTEGKRGGPSSMLWAVYSFTPVSRILGNEQETWATLPSPEEEMEVPKDLGKKAIDSLFCMKWCVHILTRLLESDTGSWYKWLSSDCCPDSTRINKIKVGTQKSQVTWEGHGFLWKNRLIWGIVCVVWMIELLCPRARRNTQDPREPKP